jgi:cellulose synthase/poly-beta-1,6-N-acetylglucosamine synthase-like glycosyltransferase
MIIQILSDLFEEGYQKREKYSLLSPFFAGANVAFRSVALSQIGPYDENCSSGEDQDVCLRMANAGWELYFEPKAKVRHKNRLTLRAFVRQWFNYGFHHPYLFKKYHSKGLRIYRTSSKREKGAIYKSFLNTRFPFSILVFFTPFLAMHLLLALTILFAVVGLDIPAIIGGVGTFAIAVFYFKSDIDWRNILRTSQFVFLRYVGNLALLLGGFSGGAKVGTLYISATFDAKDKSSSFHH